MCGGATRAAWSPGVDGVTVAGQRLGGGSRVHVASVGPPGGGRGRGCGRFGGVMLLHGGQGRPWAGALGSSGSPFLLIGTERENTAQNKHERTH